METDSVLRPCLPFCWSSPTWLPKLGWFCCSQAAVPFLGPRSDSQPPALAAADIISQVQVHISAAGFSERQILFKVSVALVLSVSIALGWLVCFNWHSSYFWHEWWFASSSTCTHTSPSNMLSFFFFLSLSSFFFSRMYPPGRLVVLSIFSYLHPQFSKKKKKVERMKKWIYDHCIKIKKKSE